MRIIASMPRRTHNSPVSPYHQVFWVVWAALLIAIPGTFSVAAVPVVDDKLPFERRSVEDEVRLLIQQLDDSSYSVRENASLRLTEIGLPALRSLAMGVFEASPEKVWRTRMTLEAIGTRGDEDVFFKSAGILQLLFSDSGDSLRPRILQLQQQWQVEQKKAILSRLIELGAHVHDHQNGRIAFNNDPLLFQQHAWIDGPLEVVTVGGDSRSESSNRRHVQRRVQLDVDSATRKIDKILLASTEANRDLVLGSLTAIEEDEEPSTDKQIQRQIALQRLEAQVQFDAMARRQFINSATQRGITISFGENWTGTAEDLQPLDKLSDLNRIEIHDVSFSDVELSQIASLQGKLSVLIRGNSIDDQQLVLLAKMPHLTNLEFENRDISPPLLVPFGKSKTLVSIAFINCDVSPPALARLKSIQTLGAIYLSDMQIEPEIFEILETFPNLSYVNLSICKFQTAAFRRLEAAKPNLQIAYTPQAFLGVRGPINLTNNLGCEISEVIPGSGADKGGLKIGDVIEEVNGQPIDKFEDLRLHIAQHKAGEALEVNVRRNGERVDLTIVLGKFDRNLE